MTSHTLIVLVFLVIVGLFGVQGAIGDPDYCGKPCTDRGSFICAYNQKCYTVFMNRCAMKKRNCDYHDRFLEVPLSGCLLGGKCRGI